MVNPEKELHNWSKLKASLYYRIDVPFFKEREVWWTSIGFNIGGEENGKNQYYERPVVVIKKFNNNIFLGLPLTTKIRNGKFYYRIRGKKVDGDVILSQVRLLDSKRLVRKIETLDEKAFSAAVEKFKKLL